MGSLLMEALISSTTPSSPAQPPTMASPNPNFSPSPALTAETAPSEASPNLAEPDFSSLVMMDISEETMMEDNDEFPDNPICGILDLVNATVVPRKPSIFEVPLPSGEHIPKSHYIAEKKAMYAIIQSQKKEVLKTQVEKMAEVIKTQETETKLQKVAKVVGEMHLLYGQFVQTLLALMKKCHIRSKTTKESLLLLTVGPFPNAQEVDSLVAKLCELANYFQSDFEEGFSNSKNALTEITNYLRKQHNNSTSSNPSTTTSPQATVATAEQPVVGEETGGAGGGGSFSVEGSMSANTASSGIQTITIPEQDFLFDEEFNMGFSTAANSSNDESTHIITPTEPAAGSSSSLVPQSSVSSLSNDAESIDLSAFLPVPNPNQRQLEGGKTLYTLVEYPEPLNLVNKKHGFDSTKSRRGVKGSWLCICGQSFPTASLIKYHVRYFSAKWRFKCTVCSRRYPGLNFLKLHSIRAHNKLHIEPESITSPPPPQNNNSTPRQIDPVPSTSTTTAVVAAPSSNPVLVVNGTKCACGTELGTKEALFAHIRLEAETHGQHFKCNLCDEVFDHRCNLKNHSQEKHQDYQGGLYGCSFYEATLDKHKDLESQTTSEHQMDQDPLSINLSTDGEGTSDNDNTITFHIDTSSIDGPTFTMVEPQVVTLDD